MSGPLHKDPLVVSLASQSLSDLRDACRSLTYGTVVTDDGFVVAKLATREVRDSSMASMASSMQALGDAVTRELQLGSSEYIIMTAETGYVIQMRVQGHGLVLSAVFETVETVGKALSASRVIARDMASLLMAAAA